MPGSTMQDVDAALALARGLGVDRLDAQLLLLHALGEPAAELHARRSWLLAHGEQHLAEDAQAGFAALLRRRLAGEPLAYLVGHKEFHGLDLLVDPRVLVPRPDTETLVEWALERLDAAHPATEGEPRSVLDLGTGSGAIALALQSARPGLQVDAVDASADALAVAAENARRLGLPVRFLQGRWLAPVRQRYDCIIANPPYIAPGDPHLAALTHEPLEALVAGDGGLADLREIVRTAPAHLQPDGWLLLEHGFDQAPAVRALLAAEGYADIRSRLDLGGHARCSGGRHGGARARPPAMHSHGEGEIIPPVNAQGAPR